VYHCALKIQKIFLNIFYREDPTFYTAFGEASKEGGLLCEARVLGFARGSWRWGCAEEWLGLKDLPKLGWRMLAVSRAQKNPELLHPGYLILPMTEIVFQESM
jgi:hypothetical protein